MDAVLNTNIGFFGADLIGYPHIKEGGGNYNGTFQITDESPKTNYQRMPTDDLSHIWATNHRDNIVDLDVQLRQANINAVDPEYYGVKNIDFIAPATADMWDFGKFLNPRDKHIDGFVGDLPRKHIDGLADYTPNPGTSNSMQQSITVVENTESTLKKNVCYPLWMILIAIVLAIFGGAYFLGSIVTPQKPVMQNGPPAQAPQAS
jgi:hypothetical protein